MRIRTDICLDESIVHARAAAHALALGSCRLINIKIGRVGGYTEALGIHDTCQAHGAPVWCGGMLECGIGRAHNLALASLPNFSLPGDISASKRYWARDVITKPFEVAADGTVEVPDRHRASASTSTTPSSTRSPSSVSSSRPITCSGRIPTIFAAYGLQAAGYLTRIS